MRRSVDASEHRLTSALSTIRKTHFRPPGAERTGLAAKPVWLNIFMLGLFVIALPSAICTANEKYPNIADRSTLPRENGLAGQFSRDQGIARHASVIFSDDFESGKLIGRWDDAEEGQVNPLSFWPPEDERGGKRCLKVEARLGENHGGGLTRWFEPVDTVFVRFYVKFDLDCDYIHHFVTLRANKGLRGRDRWSGFGGAGLKPDGINRFSTAMEPWGDWGRNPPPGKWNFYSYWHEMAPAPDNKYWGNSFLVVSQEPIIKGNWICAEFMLKHNTPGQPDGEQAMWVDGQLLGHWQGINWRLSDQLQANALTLESYVTDAWTENPVNVVYFDNVVIASEYIGPVGN